jgi:cell division protein ZapA (FtsZ GTPase activity inhibitor)
VEATRTITVELSGHRLSLKTELSAEDAREAEALVRREVDALRERSGQVQNDKLALVAALKIAGQLVEERSRHQALRRSVRERSRRILTSIDAVGREVDGEPPRAIPEGS